MTSLGAFVWPGAVVCCRCSAVMREAQPGHEGAAVSHGICEACVPVYRAAMGLPAKEQARRTA